MYIQTFIYLTYLSLLSLYVIDDNRSSDFLILPFTINLCLYLYELIFILILFTQYFQDPWNIVDSIRSILTFSYCFLVWSKTFDIKNGSNSAERYTLSLLIFISWIRGITYFRITKSTRYLNKLLFQVCKEIVPFLIILFYSILTFGLALSANDPEKEFFNHLTDSYLIIIGTWDNPNQPQFFSIFLLLATLLNPIVTLNLLIAILTDTFEVVKENEDVADAQELIGMIVEMETLMFWKRGKNIMGFVHVAEADSDENEDDFRIEMMIKNLKNKVDGIGEEMKSYEKDFLKFQGKIKEWSGNQIQGLTEFLK